MMWGKRQEAEDNTANAAAEAPVPPEAAAAETQAPPAMNAQGFSPAAGQPQAAAADAPPNGAAAQAPAPAPGERTQAFWRGKLATANFGAAVALFMHSPAHKHLALSDLEQRLVPPLRLNQYMMAEVKAPNGQAVPAALVLWARVSAEIDARLSATPGFPVRLHSDEWQSGDVIWIMDAVGEPRAVQQCIEALKKTAFQGKRFKMLKPWTEGAVPAKQER